METNLPTPTTTRVYVNLPEGTFILEMFQQATVDCRRVPEIHLSAEAPQGADDSRARHGMAWESLTKHLMNDTKPVGVMICYDIPTSSKKPTLPVVS